VHGIGFESLTFWGQWWCSAWSSVRMNLCLFGVNGGVVHGRGFESLGVIGGVVHGLGFESFTFWGSMAVNNTFWANRRRHIEKQRRLSFALHTNHTRISCRC
jgi:hypothetical protein